MFDAEQGEEDWLAYIRFKLPLLLPQGQTAQGSAATKLVDTARAILASKRRLVLDKSDTGFRCRGPRCD